MKNRFMARFTVMLVAIVALLFSCNQPKKLQPLHGLSGTWMTTHDGDDDADFMKFDGDNSFVIKHHKHLYSGDNFFEWEGDDLPQKSILKLKYVIDSVDVNNGYYYTIAQDSFAERRFALVDYPFLISCGIKPKPKHQSYLYRPRIYVADTIDAKEVEPNYFNYAFILPDTLSFGEIVLNFNDPSVKSSIKTQAKKVEINHLGVSDIAECFDPRYYAFEQYRSYLKTKEGLQEIPFLHKKVFFGYGVISKEELEAKKAYISKILPSDTSKCLIFSNLNMARWYYKKYHASDLEGTDVVMLKYTNRKLLFERYDARYRGE